MSWAVVDHTAPRTYCTVLSPSVSWCNATTPFLGMAFGPTHWHVPSGMKQALTYYGLSTIDLPVEQLLYIEPG